MAKYSWELPGLEFESDLVELISNVSKKEWGVSAFLQSTRQQDIKEGTDCVVLGVPIDVTLNFDKKNKMWDSAQIFDLGLCRIRFGVRYGNDKRSFAVPTLVIGIESYSSVKTWLVNILDEVKKYIKEILENGIDLYNERVYPEV